MNKIYLVDHNKIIRDVRNKYDYTNLISIIFNKLCLNFITLRNLSNICNIERRFFQSYVSSYMQDALRTPVFSGEIVNQIFVREPINNE